MYSLGIITGIHYFFNVQGIFSLQTLHVLNILSAGRSFLKSLSF